MEAWLKDPFFFGEDILNTMHVFAGPWLDYFMVAITGLGSQLFYLIILPVLYWNLDRGTALKVSTVFLLSATLNSFMKDLYMNPRPDAAKLLPGISELNQAFIPRKSPGFPSGHTQVAVAFWGAIMYYTKKKPVIIISILFILLIPYSRIYLGVHYLGDVLGGYLLGFISLAILFPANSFFEKNWRTMKKSLTIALLLLLPLLVVILLPGMYFNRPLGFIAAMLLGAFLGHEGIDFNPRAGAAAGIIKFFTGIPLILLLTAVQKFLLPRGKLWGYFTYWLIGFWITFGAPLLFSRFEKLRGPRKKACNNTISENNL